MSVFNSVKSPSVVRLNGIVIQQSTYGIPLPIGWGTNRVGASLIWYNGFKAQAVKQSSGKGGGSTTTGYNYSASIIMAIADGPITGVRNVYKDQNVYVPGTRSGLAQAGLSLTLGAQGQAVWGYLTTNFASQAIGYSRTAYAYASNYPLTSSATLSNHSFEVQWASRATVSGSTIDDANPADILNDFLTNAYYGVPLWASGLVASLTSYSNYCTAAGLFLSPLLASTSSAAQFVTDLLDASNSDCVWSNGQLKVVPLGDTAITNNGVTFTPYLTPQYNLGEDDFIPASEGDDPVTIDLAKLADAYNSVQIGFSDRSLNYNQNIATADDMGSIATYGARRENPHTLSMICDANVAAAIAQLRVQRLSNLRRTFKFSLDWRYCLLEPLDLVTLTTGDLSAVLVRINEIKENADGGLDVVAEEMLVGANHAAVYTRQVTAGTIINTSIAPGSVAAPVLINPARTLTNNDLQVWVAVSGGTSWGGCQVFTSADGTNYEYAGTLTAPARYGVTTGALGAVADPDTTSSFGVNLTASLGTLNSATLADVNAGSTLCLIDSELISYQVATLTSANNYTLGTRLRRGLMGTTVAAHSVGAPFVRLDGGIFKYSYTPQQVGTTAYVKFCSFNIYGQSLEDISTVTAYSLTLSAASSSITFGTLSGVPANVAALTGSEAIQNSILQGNLTGGSVVPAVSSAITGQGALATLSIISYGSSYTSGFGTLAGASAVNFGGAITETSGGSTATLANFKTLLGTAASITGQGDLATANRSSIAQGSNGVINSDFTAGSTAWWFGYGSTNMTSPTPVYNNAINLGGYYGLRNVVYSEMLPASGTFGGAYYYFGWCQNGFNGTLTNLQRSALQCAAGDRILFGSLVAAHGCTNCFTRIRFFNSAGSLLLEYDAPATGFVNARTGGLTGANGDPANFYTAAGYTDAPAGTAFVVIGNYAYVVGTETSAYIFMTAPYIVKGFAGQTTPPPYAPGPVDRLSDNTLTNTAAGVSGQGNFATANAYISATDPALSGSVADASIWLISGGNAYLRNAGAWQLLAAPNVRDGDVLFGSGTAGSSSYTIPTTALGFVTVTLVGGRGGAGQTTGANNLGGSGSYGTKHFAVSPGDVISFTLGGNGANSPTSTGGSGSGSSLTCAAHGVSVTTNGGSGGTIGAVGAGAAAGSGGDTNVAGTAGGSGGIFAGCYVQIVAKAT